MKTSRSSFASLLGAGSLGVVVLLSACSKTRDTTADTADTSTPATSGTMTNASASLAANENWDALKTYSYDQRSEFATKATDYAARIDTRLTNATGEASTRLAEARDELRNAAAEVSNATAETWEATKERVGRAWQKAEAATQSVAE